MKEREAEATLNRVKELLAEAEADGWIAISVVDLRDAIEGN